MKSVSGAQFAKVLEKHGWTLLRVREATMLWQVGKNRAYFDPHTSKSASENWITASFAESSGTRRKRFEITPPGGLWQVSKNEFHAAGFFQSDRAWFGRGCFWR